MQNIEGSGFTGEAVEGVASHLQNLPSGKPK
jgi:hypothetical protein